MFENEEWAPIEEFPQYMVSNYGRIKHVDRIHPRNVIPNERGFPVVQLSSATSTTRYLRQVNKLVAKAFLHPPYYVEQNSVWHKDGDLTNCRAENLMWETRPRVLEWNEMHRTGVPKYKTPRVQNNRTGTIYENAYACAMAEGVLESQVIWKIENRTDDPYSDSGQYRYMYPDE